MLQLSQEFSNNILAITFVFVMSIVFSLTFIFFLRRNARQLGLVDEPDGKRKLHGRSIPVIGGMGFFAAMVAALLLSGIVLPGFWKNVKFPIELIGLSVSATFLLIVGVVDDRFGVRGRQKLLAQMASVLILILSGITISKVTIFGETYLLGWMSIPIVFVWMLGTINSINLIDGADGIAGTVGIIVGATITIMAIWHEQFVDAAIAAGLTGSLIAYLYFNLPPASIFMGDAGSMVIGLLLGAIAIRCSFKQSFAYSFAAPVAILAIPFFDSLVAIVRRVLTGRSVYSTDRGHLHHTLLRRGLSSRGMLVIFGGLCTITAVCGTICIFTKQELVAFIGVGLLLIGLVFCRIFGFAEFQLIRNRISSFGRSLLVLKPSKSSPVSENRIRIQGSRNWDSIWVSLVEFAEKHSLSEMKLDLNAPWLHEGYHATWNKKHDDAPDQSWQLRLPLFVGERNCGRLVVVGPAFDNTILDTHRLLNDIVDELQDSIAVIAEQQNAIRAETNLTEPSDEVADAAS